MSRDGYLPEGVEQDDIDRYYEGDDLEPSEAEEPCDQCGDQPCGCPPDTFKPSPGVRFVNVYLLDRQYGGPEEGGWWYDIGDLIESHAVPTAEADALADRLGSVFSNEGRRPISSVLSEGQYSIRVEQRPGVSWPARVPHYE